MRVVSKNANAMLRMSEVLLKTKDNPRYYEDLMACGQLQNEILYIEPRNFEKLSKVIQKHNPKLQPKAESKMKGLGDLIAKPAQFIAKGVDYVAGTNLSGCSGCHQRQEWLNKKVPF